MANPPVSLNDLFALHSRVTALLDRAGIAHCLAGGLAVSVWGEPRTTFDVDVVVAIAPGQIDQLLAALSADPQFALAPDEFALPPQVTIVRAPIVVTPVDSKQPEIVVVDFLVVPPALSESILTRAISIDVAGSRRNVCTPEDLILLKLLSARIKDREDVRLVLAAQSGRLDLEYVARWTATLGVEAEWKRFAVERPETP